MTTDSLSLPAATPQRSTLAQPWLQLVIGVICMMAISSPQYVWTLFTKPLTAALGVSLAELQVTFSILIVLQTFCSPFQGALIDRFGPRKMIALGALLTGASWILASRAQGLWMLYLSYGVLGGVGTGVVYVGIVGLMVKWFPRRRGFAAGTVAAGYGMGAMLTTFPISSTLARDGYAQTLVLFGIIIMATGVIAAQFLRLPVGTGPAADLPVTASDLPPARMLRTRLFWLMFVMMTLMSTSGLMVTSQMASFARDFGVAGLTVLGYAALPLALTIDRFTNGLTRPFFGWLSDHIGRENTMGLAFLLEALAMTAWLLTHSNPLLFVLLSGVVFFGWGEIFSLFPSTLADSFGTRFATANYGCLYIAQGVGSVLGGPLAAMLRESSGSWTPVFALAIGADVLTALLAWTLLRSWRASQRRAMTAASPS